MGKDSSKTRCPSPAGAMGLDVTLLLIGTAGVQSRWKGLGVCVERTRAVPFRQGKKNLDYLSIYFIVIPRACLVQGCW